MLLLPKENGAIFAKQLSVAEVIRACSLTMGVLSAPNFWRFYTETKLCESSAACPHYTTV